MGDRGAGRVSAGNLGEGGAKFFFLSGPKRPPSRFSAIFTGFSEMFVI